MLHSYDVGKKDLKIKRVPLEQAQREWDAHLAVRPSYHDIPARTAWAQKKDRLESQLKTAVLTVEWK